MSVSAVEAKKREQWRANFAKRKQQKQEDAKLTETVNTQPQATKKGSNCGNPVCCMRVGGRAEVTYEGPTMLDGNGMDRGGYTFKSIEPPMLCGGTAWAPKQLTKWERQRKDAAAAPGLSDFKKKPNGSTPK